MRWGVLAAVACFSVVGVCGADDAKASVRRMISIPAEPLGVALQTLARDRDLQVIYQSEVVGDRKTAGAAGEFTPEEALGKLLEGTGLTYRYLNETTVTIVPVSIASSSLLPGTGEGARRADEGKDTQHEEGAQKRSFWERFRVAEVGQGRAGSDISVDQEKNDSSRKNEKNPKGLEEVVVTAQKREQRSLDVPISLVALNNEELQSRNVHSLDDLSFGVPGLSIRSSGTYQRQITLRGMSNVFGASSLIGLYLDEGPVTTAPFDQLDLHAYDLERVEVLRGPQGTLYGEGSVGGTIRFITKNPVLDRFDARADVTGLMTEESGPSQRVEGVVNVPLIENQLGLRIVGRYDHEDGWIDQPAAGRRDFNTENAKDVRLKGLWRPIDQFSAAAMAVVHRMNAPPSTGEDANGNYRQVFNLTTTPSATDDYDIQSLTLTYDFGPMQLLSATNRIKQDKRASDLGFRFPLNAPPAKPFDLYNPLRVTGAYIWNEELRLTSAAQSPWQWTVGAFYHHAKIDHFRSQLFAVPGPPGTPLPRTTTLDDHGLSKSWAVFGDANYKWTERLTVGLGLRNFEDDEDFDSGTNGVETVPQSGTFHALNPRAYAQYAAHHNLNLYASAAKGFRSGGFNSLNQPAYGPEHVWTYEVGTKMLLFDGRLSLDTAIFYSDYSDYQISGILPPPAPITPILSNNGDVSIKGIEWAVTWSPTDEWILSFNGNDGRSRFTRINLVAGSARFSVGDRLDLFPNYQYAASVQRNFTWIGRKGFARLNYSEQGPSIYRNRIRPWYFSYSDVINMLNLNMNMQMTDNMTAGLFAQNLLNDRGYTDPFSIEQNAARARPRTWGVQFSFKLD